MAVNDMSKKESLKDVKIIIQYKDNTDEKGEKSLQELIQKLFNSYMTKLIQNINKGK
jgi:hypothetical protein